MIRGHFDGASRGNPGPAGAGAVIYDDGKVIWRCAEPLGTHTNNEAEYLALGILASELKRRGLHGMEICGDSRLVISQVTGKWQIREPRLRELASPVISLVRELGARCLWVPREQNSEADRMSNKALDEGHFTEDLSASGGSEADPAEKTRPESVFSEILQAAPGIWIVSDGNERYAVDLKHGCCTCAAGRKEGRCPHITAVLMKKAVQKHNPGQN
jgi:ribonuclease HI